MSMWSIWTTIKSSKIHVLDYQKEKRKKEKGKKLKKYFKKMMANNFSKIDEKH